MKHIILIGFMGSGKTTVGVELAKKLHRPLYDNDELVVDNSGMSIAKLIERYGEDHFRQVEIDTFQELLAKNPGVIATGGGIINTEARRTLLNKIDAHIIWLKTDFKTSATRVSHDLKNVRPLFADEHKAKDLFNERQELYESMCDFAVDANQSITEVADEIITKLPKRCYIVGDPVSHSFSPYLHNSAYKLLGIDSEYIYEAERVPSSDLVAAVQRMRAADVRGVSVTVPHKIAVMEHLDSINPLAEQIGAVNTVVNDSGQLHGFNTDAEGVLQPLLARTKTKDLSGKKVLIIGAGGAARAAAFVCANSKAAVTIANRTLAKAETLAKSVKASSASIEHSIKHNADFDIVFNATSVGMGPVGNTDTPLPNAAFLPNQIVFDAVYTPHDTQLLRDAGKTGATVIHGLEMLGFQAIGQIKRYTGHDIDIQTVMDILKEKLHS